VTHIRHSRDLGEGQRRNLGSRNHKAAALVGEILRSDLHHLGDNPLRLLDDTPRTDLDARSADGHRTRVERAVPGLDQFRVSLHDVDIFDWHLQRVGGNLRQHGRLPVTLAH